MRNDITVLYDKAFACWRRSNKQADPTMRACWEATAQQYITAALAMTKIHMQGAPPTSDRGAFPARGADHHSPFALRR